MEALVPPTKPRPASMADQAAVLTKATLRAATQLGLTNKLLATVIGFRYADHGREQLVGQAELGRGPERRLGENGGLVGHGCRARFGWWHGSLHFCRNNICLLY